MIVLVPSCIGKRGVPEARLVPFCSLQATDLTSSPKLALARSRDLICLIRLPLSSLSVPSLIGLRHLPREGEKEMSNKFSSLDGCVSNDVFLFDGEESNNVLLPPRKPVAGSSNRKPMWLFLLIEFNISRGIFPFSPVSPPFPFPFPFFFLVSHCLRAPQRTHGFRLASQGRGPRVVG
jgi:hypothetical protein